MERVGGFALKEVKDSSVVRKVFAVIFMLLIFITCILGRVQLINYIIGASAKRPPPFLGIINKAL